MSDPQARAAEQLTGSTVRVQVVNVGTVTGFLRAESAAHVAAALAEAGLLADLETRRFGAIFDDLDAARAELAEVKKQGLSLIAELQQVKAERDNCREKWRRAWRRAERVEAALGRVQALAGDMRSRELDPWYWSEIADELDALLGEES